MLRCMIEMLFKLLVGIAIIIAVVSVFVGHADHVKREAMGLNKPVSYHAPKQHNLVCNGVVIARGVIKYENGRSAAKVL